MLAERGGLRGRRRHPSRPARARGRRRAHWRGDRADGDGRQRTRLRGRRALRGSARARRSAVGDRGHRPLRRRAYPSLAAPAASRCTRSTAPAAPSGGCAARTTNSTLSAPPALHSHTSVGRSRGRRASGGAAAAAAGQANRGRGAAGRARAVAQRDRHRTRRAPRRAASAAARRAAQPLQPLPPLQLAHARPARHDPRAAHARPPHPGRHHRGRDARARDPRPCPRARPRAPRRARCRPDRRRPTDHHLVTPTTASTPKPAFARLAGVAPLPASSGLTTRHRLSRGGDRQLNRALHTVILHRRQHDPATRDYIARRITEGKSSRDATRLLKRYLARHLYRVMQNSTPLTT